MRKPIPKNRLHWPKTGPPEYTVQVPEDCPSQCPRRDDGHDCRACESDAYNGARVNRRAGQTCKSRNTAS